MYTKIALITLLVSLLSACTSSIPSPKRVVTIERDQYGTPHIYADDAYGLFYGYGYAVGQDRLFQMEMLKRTVLGRVSEVLGSKYIPLDIKTLSSYSQADINSQIARLNVEERRILEGYAAGLNAWLLEVNQAPEKLMPAEFSHFDFKPTPWSVYDVVMAFVGSMTHRYADFNEEIANLALLTSLSKQYGIEKAWHIFDASMPLYDDQSPTTVPDSESSRTRGPEHQQPPPYIQEVIGSQASLRREVFYADGSYYQAQDTLSHKNYQRAEFARSGTPGPAGFSSASNLWLLNGSKLKGASNTLVNGPQFGWSLPSYVYGINLNGGGFNVSGNTLLAYPAHLFGHNRAIGWGSTAGFGDLVDIYYLRLNPKNPEQYWYKGRYISMEKYPVSIPIKDAQTQTHWVYRSRYGPVINLDKTKGIAFSKHRSWEGSEVENLLAWIALGKAQNYHQFKQQIGRLSANINFYYMDKRGNIGYIHAGKYPKRHPQHDNRLPVPGDGRYDWLGFLSFDENPQVYNPSQHYLYNWNNRPERNWPSSDLWWANWSRGHRAKVLDTALSAGGVFTKKQAWELNQMASHRDLNADFLIPELIKAAAHTSNKEVRQAIQLLTEWDRFWLDKDLDGRFDHPANLIMHHWLKRLLEQVFKDDIGDDFWFRFAATGYPITDQIAAISMQPGTKILVRQLSDPAPVWDFFNGEAPHKVLLDSFEHTLATLRKTEGSSMDNWRIATHPLKFVPYNFRGVPQALPDAAISLPLIMNRGSENNQFTTIDGEIRGVDVIPPAQSGFIARGQTGSDYPVDQLEMYQNFQFKPIGSHSGEGRKRQVLTY